MDKTYSLNEVFKSRTGEADDEKVSSFLLEAEKTILSKTNRKTMIAELDDFKLKLAISRYVRQGNEGFSSYAEGGESESYLTEDEIISGVKEYRLTAIGRRIQNEKEKPEDI